MTAGYVEKFSGGCCCILVKRDLAKISRIPRNDRTFSFSSLSIAVGFPSSVTIAFPPAESVYKIPGDDSRFYAVFTTSMNGLMGSAICTFSLDDIQDAFLGRFKEQATSSSAWLPVLTSKVPEPRPGQCVNDTQTLPGKSGCN